MSFPNTARCIAHGTFFGGEIWQNVFHIKSSDDTEPTLTDFTAWEPAIRQLYASERATKSDEWAMTGTRWRSMHAEDRPTFIIPAVGVVGQSTSHPMPPQVALVTTWVSADGALAPRYGRIYRNGYSEGHDDGFGKVATGTVNAEGNAAAAMIVSLALVGGVLVIASAAGVPQPAGGQGTTYVVTDVAIDNVWDTQRRRSNGLTRTRTVF